jgi:hypothetical protein
MLCKISTFFLTALSFAGCSSAQNLPGAADLVTPPGHEKVFEFKTLPSSVQIYTCKAGAGNSFTWAGPDPDAILIGLNDKNLTVHHYRGPTWETTDGSVVKASNPKHFQAARENAVDWLQLKANGGTQQFAKVAYIHRIDTQGGVAPDPASHACDATHAGDQVRVPYSAKYQFYAPSR